jgi:hypothetical protein
MVYWPASYTIDVCAFWVFSRIAYCLGAPELPSLKHFLVQRVVTVLNLRLQIGQVFSISDHFSTQSRQKAWVQQLSTPWMVIALWQMLQSTARCMNRVETIFLQALSEAVNRRKTVFGQNWTLVGGLLLSWEEVKWCAHH